MARKTEKNLTVNPIKAWAKSKNFFIIEVESKAVYSQAIGRYIHSQSTPGTPDLLGCNDEGLAMFIECKAPGRLKTVREKQYAFLTRAIKQGAFAVVSDSVDRVEELYTKFITLLDIKERKEFLMSVLPKPKITKPPKNFDFF